MIQARGVSDLRTRITPYPPSAYGTPNRVNCPNFFTIRAIVGLPHGTSKLPAFSVYPILYPGDLIHELVYGHDKPEEQSAAPRHNIHLALKWQDELKSNPSMTMSRIAENNGFSRARVSQIMALLKLDRHIQRHLLSISDSSEIRHFSERKLKHIAACKTRVEQVATFKELVGAYSGD